MARLVAAGAPRARRRPPKAAFDGRSASRGRRAHARCAAARRCAAAVLREAGGVSRVIEAAQAAEYGCREVWL